MNLNNSRKSKFPNKSHSIESICRTLECTPSWQTTQQVAQVDSIKINKISEDESFSQLNRVPFSKNFFEFWKNNKHNKINLKNSSSLNEKKIPKISHESCRNKNETWRFPSMKAVSASSINYCQHQAIITLIIGNSTATSRAYQMSNNLIETSPILYHTKVHLPASQIYLFFSLMLTRFIMNNRNKLDKQLTIFKYRRVDESQ